MTGKFLQRAWSIVGLTAGRPAVLYLAAALLAAGLTDQPRRQRKILDCLKPGHAGLLAAHLAGRDPDRATLRDHIRYYQKVTQFFPGLGGAHAVLGYCYYYAGDPQAAAAQYRAAAAADPGVFWYPADLGIIHFRRGEWKEAADAFDRALKLDPGPTLLAMRYSITYRELLQGLDDDTLAKTPRRLKQAYAQCQLLRDLARAREQSGVEQDRKATGPADGLRLFLL